jgi:ATP-dependent protease HslVU (ClpYQ) peptidase subunit
MKNIVKVALAATLLLSLGSTVASADAAKGQKLYKKKLSHACGMNGAKMAAKHTQEEWESKKATLAEEIKTICPSAKDKALKEKYLPHYFDFFHNFASDSGNVPSC